MTPRRDLPAHFRAAVADAFNGERVLWAARPDCLASPLATLPLPLLALPWAICAVCFELSLVNNLIEKGTTRSIEDSLALLVCFVFVVAGIYALMLPLRKWREARRTVFAVGEKRLGIVTVGSVRGNARFHDLGIVLHTERLQRRDGTGTLTLAIGQHSGGEMLETCTEVLRGIPDVHHVEQLIRAHIGSAGRTT